MFHYTLAYSRDVVLRDIKEREKKISKNAKQQLSSNLGCSALVLENWSYSRAWQRHKHARSEAVCYKLNHSVRCSISKPFPDRETASTACPVLSSIDYTLQHLSTNTRNKSQAKFQRFGSKSGHEHFSKGQRCLAQVHSSRNNNF